MAYVKQQRFPINYKLLKFLINYKYGSLTNFCANNRFSETMVYKWTRGMEIPFVNKLRQLAKALDVNPLIFYTNDDQINREIIDIGLESIKSEKYDIYNEACVYLMIQIVPDILDKLAGRLNWPTDVMTIAGDKTTSITRNQSEVNDHG